MEVIDQERPEVAAEDPPPETAKALALAGGPEVGPRRADLIRTSLADMRQVAEMMANSGPMVPPPFQGSVERCMAIVYLADRWGMDPVAVASQSYIVPTKQKGLDGEAGERLAFQAQLVAALVHQAPNMVGRLHFTFKGEGTRRYVIVSGKLKGDKRVKTYSSPTIAQITVKNSPLWFSDPDQQLAYYGERAWARRYMPEALMGVYAVDEITVEDVTPPTEDPLDRAARYGEPEAEDAEFVDLEPSGGEEAAQKAQERSSGADGQSDHPNAPPRQATRNSASPGPSGGDGQPQEPQSLAADKRFVGDHVDVILKMEDAAKAQAAWHDLAESAEFKRVVAYDQAVASAAKRTVARHVAALKGGEA